MNLLYVVVIEDFPSTLISPILRNHEAEDYNFSREPLKYRVYIGPSARFARFKGAAYMETEELANCFIEHCKPIMKKRGYSSYPMSVISFRPDKWDVKRFLKVIPKIKALLGNVSTGT